MTNDRYLRSFKILSGFDIDGITFVRISDRVPEHLRRNRQRSLFSLYCFIKTYALACVYMYVCTHMYIDIVYIYIYTYINFF